MIYWEKRLGSCEGFAEPDQWAPMKPISGNGGKQFNASTFFSPFYVQHSPIFHIDLLSFFALTFPRSAPSPGWYLMGFIRRLEQRQIRIGNPRLLCNWLCDLGCVKNHLRALIFQSE